MSLRKKNTSAKKISHHGPGATGGTADKASPMAAEVSRGRLLELFSLIEKEFDSLNAENAARECNKRQNHTCIEKAHYNVFEIMS